MMTKYMLRLIFYLWCPNMMIDDCDNIQGWYLTGDIHYSDPQDDKYYWWLIIIYSSLPDITAVKLTQNWMKYNVNTGLTATHFSKKMSSLEPIGWEDWLLTLNHSIFCWDTRTSPVPVENRAQCFPLNYVAGLLEWRLGREGTWYVLTTDDTN